MLRFAAEFDMDIFWKTDSDVRKFLEVHADRMNDIPQERWGREIMKGLIRRPYRFISMCDTYGILPFFLKDLEDMKKAPDGKGGNIFSHVMNLLAVIEARLDTNKIIQSDAFVLAGLLWYVVVKGAEITSTDKARDRAISDCLTRWNITSETIDNVTAILNNYNFFYTPVNEEEFCHQVLNYSRKAILVGLQFAKCVAIAEGTLDEYRDVLENNTWNLNQVIRRFNTVELQTEGSTRYMTGREIMSLLHMKPGKRVGELLEGLDLAVGVGKVGSRAAAEEWLKSQSA